MAIGLTEKHLTLIRWSELRSGGHGSAEAVGERLRALLLEDADTAQDAYRQLENAVVSQHDLFQCAPAVVSVIVAAVAEGVIPAANLALALDQLGRILGGYPDMSELRLGNQDLRQQCLDAAARGYWALMKVAWERDEHGAWEVARDVLKVLDPEHSSALLGAE